MKTWSMSISQQSQSKIRRTVARLCVLTSIASSTACSQQRSGVAVSQQGAAQNNSGTPQTNLPGSIFNWKLPNTLTLFGERVPLDIPEVRERAEREFYLNLQQPAQILLNLKRTGRYFELFSSILKEKGLPDDIKYLAVAESALYMSRSGKDAVGIWQFIEGTAKRYGLEVNESVDERRHVEKSTRAAADYLLEAKQRFGSWTMAAAAYNMGVEGAQFNMDLQGSSNYYELYFNEETSRYVLRIAIIKELLEHAETYGFKLSSDDYYHAERSKRVKEYRAIDNLASWATQHGMSYKELKLLNPWMMKTSLPKPKNGFWEILVSN